jgi:ribonucleotide reductase beta subunit family protein with ferritin-like domain
MTQHSGRVNVTDKRIFGGESDLNQLVPFKYGWAWSAYLEGNKNHWLPGHLHLATDLKGAASYFDILPDTLYGCIQGYLGTRVVMASVLLDLLPHIYKLTTAPECRQYILRQMQELSVWADVRTEHGPLFLATDPAILDAQYHLQNALHDVEARKRHVVSNHVAAMSDQGGQLVGYAESLLLVMFEVGMLPVAGETFLLKEVELPPELRRLISLIQRDSILMRRFYTNLVCALLDENPALKTSLLEVGHLHAIRALHRSFLTECHGYMAQFGFVNDRSVQFSMHVFETTYANLGLDGAVTPTPYSVKAIVETQESKETLEWED